MVRHPQTIFSSWKLLIIIIVLMGVYFRFAYLDRKVYWFNEVFTSLHISGYSEHRDANPALYTGEVTTVEDLRRYQRIRPESSFFDVIRTLAMKDVNWPPLYFLMARCWAQWFGSSVLAMRSLSALISLLSIPAIYWLCLELFKRSSIGWMTCGLLSVSPIFVRYAQEARPYSLWIVMILVSSAALLRATRVQTKPSWAFYAVTVALSLYTQLFSALVVIGHGTYLFILCRFRLAATVKSYLVASAAGFLSFLPWIALMVLNFQNVIATSNHLRSSPGFRSLLDAWGSHVSHTFFAWHQEYHGWILLLPIPLLALIVYAFYFLRKHASKTIWLFVFVLAAVMILALALPDLLFGWQHTSRARYLFPSYLGTQLAVGYLLARHLFDRAKPNRFWQVATTVILLGGVLSNVASVRADTWWGLSKVDVEVAQIINQSPEPLILSEMYYGVITPLSYKLKPDARFILTREPRDFLIPAGYTNIFVYNPSEELYEALSDTYGNMKPIYGKARKDSAIYTLYQLEHR